MSMREFESVAEMKAHYAAIRKRLNPPPKPKPAIVRSVPQELSPAAAPVPAHAVAIAPPPINALGKMRKIIKAAAQHFGVTVLELESSRRQAVLNEARRIAIYLCRDLTKASMPSIGRVFGDRDHTSILHALRVVQGLVASGDEKIKADLDAVEALAFPKPGDEWIIWS